VDVPVAPHCWNRVKGCNYLIFWWMCQQHHIVGMERVDVIFWWMRQMHQFSNTVFQEPIQADFLVDVSKALIFSI
jgi:hypothetical protein